MTPGIEVKLDSALNPHPRMKPLGIHPGGSFWGGARRRDPHVLMWARVCVCVLTGYLWVSDFSLFFWHCWTFSWLCGRRTWVCPDGADDDVDDAGGLPEHSPGNFHPKLGELGHVPGRLEWFVPSS